MHDEDDWSIEEERKYIFGTSCEVFFPSAIVELHSKIVEELRKYFKDRKTPATENEILYIINTKFGPHL